jgi:hypothetical protein
MAKLLMKKKCVFKLVLSVCLSHLFLQASANGVLSGKQGIDTIPILAYDANGWSFFGEPYLKKINSDSIAVELVLIHANNLQWDQEQLVGYLGMASVKPFAERKSKFYLLNDNIWLVRVASNGQIYVKQLKGEPPAADPAVLPIKAYFKKS